MKLSKIQRSKFNRNSLILNNNNINLMNLNYNNKMIQLLMIYKNKAKN